LVRRRTLLSASSCRPWRTSHQGDSGAKYAPRIRGIGQTHWMTKGRRQPQSELMVRVARTTPEERRMPMPQHMLM
jgi:hypothetical protein